MIGGIAFGDHRKDAAETVDQVMIGAFPADHFHQAAAELAQAAVILFIERRQQAFGGVKNDPGRDVGGSDRLGAARKGENWEGDAG